MIPAAAPLIIGLEEWDRLDHVADVLERRPLASFDGQQALELLAAADVLITGWGCSPITAAVTDAAPTLALVAHAAGTLKDVVGREVWQRGVVVTSAAAANAIPVADFTVAAVVFCAKEVFSLLERYRADPRLGFGEVIRSARGLHRRRIGLVGASRVGRLVIERLRALDLEVAVTDPWLDESEARRLGVEKLELDGLLATCDIVSLHAPSLPETRHMIGRKELDILCDGAWLINTARGALVDTEALIDATADGRISALLDTTEPEPLPADSPLWQRRNVILTPHVAGSQGEELLRLGGAAVTEVERFAAGREPLHPIFEADLDRIA